jgi:hypothetical protein
MRRDYRNGFFGEAMLNSNRAGLEEGMAHSGIANARRAFHTPPAIHSMTHFMKKLFLTIAAVALMSAPLFAADKEEGFTTIFDGKTFEGWKIADADAKAWRIEDGALVAQGSRSHVYYVGDEKPFKNFEFKVDVMTKPGANGGIYFHTKYQETGWPKGGFECQVNVTQGDWIKTGSLYGLVNMALTPAQDNKWWTQHITVKGSKVTVKIDGKTVLEYNEPPGTVAGKDFERKISSGTFAFQAHDPGSVIHYKNVRVKRLD